MDVILCVKKIENEIIYSNLERDRKRVKEKKNRSGKSDLLCLFDDADVGDACMHLLYFYSRGNFPCLTHWFGIPSHKIQCNPIVRNENENLNKRRKKKKKKTRRKKIKIT